MQLVQEYQANTTSFVELIKNTPDELFNSKPDEDTWSIAENVEHIVRSEFGIARLFKGTTEKDPDRASDKIISDMKTRFSNRTNKVKAGGVVLPTEGEKSKDDLIGKFLHSRTQVTELIKTQDLDDICTQFAHPVLGKLTRKEWIYFNIVHAERHMEQIKELI
ncbi:MAG: DinB family protein [Balneola sp.]